MAQKNEITLSTILDQFREDARSNRDLGDRFERMMVQYLSVDPLYVDRFSSVWMWNDWPEKGNVGDVGIDLVARERSTGDYCAIQCKFYLPEHTLSMGDLDSFFNALGKPIFSTGMIVSTTDSWGKNAEDSLNQTKLVTRLSQHDLSESPIDWSTFNARKVGKLSLVAKKKLRPHQTPATKDVIDGLKESDRGKLIMACGTGKTFTALKIAETLSPTLAEIKKWLDAEIMIVLPRSPMGLAMGYMLNQWEALNRYVEQGWLNIDNNAAERALKRVAIGRNYARCGIM